VRDVPFYGVLKVVKPSGKTPLNNERQVNMKTTLLLAAASVAGLIAVNTATADDALLSPRAKANQPPKTAGTGSDANLVRGQNDLGVAAKAKASGNPSTFAGPSTNDPDLVRGQWTRTGSPKGLQQLRDNGREFQVAPLK
jgi:hypothetical protein